MPVASTNISPISKNATATRSDLPRVLVVDDEPAMLELTSDILRRSESGQGARIFQAASLAEARRIIEREDISLLIADVKLPDGDGTTLLKDLRDAQPTAGALIMTGAATLEHSIDCFRGGAIDYLSKPFTAQQFADRVTKALRRQDASARVEKRLVRLRSAVRKLNTARRAVSKKVDLLCNDLVSAYGDLARQFEEVRVKGQFRSTVESATDLEQMLCHTMDWLLRTAGYTNIAIYLAGEEGDFELGAYMKYTLPGSKPLTDALCNGVVETIARDEFVQWTEAEAAEHLTPAELDHLPHHGVIGVNATYLGESLATIVLFRDGKSPFTAEDAATLRAIAPIFAHVLTALAKREGQSDAELDDDAAELYGDSDRDGKPSASSDDADLDGKNWGDDLIDGDQPRGDGKQRRRPRDDDRDERPRKKKDDADWWKRGEPPPY